MYICVYMMVVINRVVRILTITVTTPVVVTWWEIYTYILLKSRFSAQLEDSEVVAMLNKARKNMINSTLWLTLAPCIAPCSWNALGWARQHRKTWDLVQNMQKANRLTPVRSKHTVARLFWVLFSSIQLNEARKYARLSFKILTKTLNKHDKLDTLAHFGSLWLHA